MTKKKLFLLSATLICTLQSAWGMENDQDEHKQIVPINIQIQPLDLAGIEDQIGQNNPAQAIGNNHFIDPNILLQQQIAIMNAETARTNAQTAQVNLASQIQGNINILSNTETDYANLMNANVGARNQRRNEAGFIEKRRKKFKNALDNDHPLIPVVQFANDRNAKIEVLERKRDILLNNPNNANNPG